MLVGDPLQIVGLGLDGRHRCAFEERRHDTRLAGEGRSASDIAAQLNLSHGTVRNYLSEAIGKLGVGNRIEAYRLARQKGWL